MIEHHIIFEEWSIVYSASVSSHFVLCQHNFPRTLEALILHLLSPVGAEVLTRKFDEMDQLTDEEDRYMLTSSKVFVLFFRLKELVYQFCLNLLCTLHGYRNKFYQVFYGAFDDNLAAMDVILSGKESFARQVMLFLCWKMSLPLWDFM